MDKELIHQKMLKQESNEPSEQENESFNKDPQKDKIKFFGSADCLYVKDVRLKDTTVS